MDASKDYYATLGVLPTIDETALTAVCRALLKKHHPDVVKGETSDGRASDIIEAYRVLADPERRRQYDVARKWPNPEGARAHGRGAWALLRRMTAIPAVSFGLRALASACVAGAIAMSPVGTRLIDALKPLTTSHGAATSAAGVPRAKLISQLRRMERDAARPVASPGASAAAAPVREMSVVRISDEAARPQRVTGDAPTTAHPPQSSESVRHSHGEVSLFRALYGHDGAH